MEKIICAAVRFQDRVWYGHRHLHALAAMHDELSYTMSRKQMIEAQTDRNQGFVTSTGRYVDRQEAWIIAVNAGQLVEKNHLEDGQVKFMLFSEDLY